MKDFINEIAATEKNISDIVSEVGRVLNEIQKKSSENERFKNRLVKWDEAGEHQYFQWTLEMGILKMRFDINDLTNNIDQEFDENGFPIENNKIDISKMEEVIKKIIISKIKI